MNSGKLKYIAIWVSVWIVIGKIVIVVSLICKLLITTSVAIALTLVFNPILTYIFTLFMWAILSFRLFDRFLNWWLLLLHQIIHDGCNINLTSVTTATTVSMINILIILRIGVAHWVFQFLKLLLHTKLIRGV